MLQGRISKMLVVLRPIIFSHFSLTDVTTLAFRLLILYNKNPDKCLNKKRWTISLEKLNIYTFT